MQPRRTIRGVKGNGAGVTAETLVERAREALPEGQPQAEESGVGMVVCARKRPLNDAERAQRALDVITCRNPTIGIHEVKRNVDTTLKVETSKFEFDHVFGEECDSSEVYLSVVEPLVRLAVCNGGLGTCFAYGQTGSGKTFTMEALERFAAADVFHYLESLNLTRDVRVAYIELADETLIDLLHDRTQVHIREDENGDTHLCDLQNVLVGDADELMEWVAVGTRLRCTKATLKNAGSSRTHAICQITIHEPGDTDKPCGQINFVDLAGSERAADQVQHNMSRQKETVAINKSLLALQECARARCNEVSNSRIHVPYRQSSLTRLLKDAFTRNDVGTVVIVCVSPLQADANHSVSTCKFADRIKQKGAGSLGINKADPRTWTKREVGEWAANVLRSGNVPGFERLPQLITEGKILVMWSESDLLKFYKNGVAARKVYAALQKAISEGRKKGTGTASFGNHTESRSNVTVLDSRDIKQTAGARRLGQTLPSASRRPTTVGSSGAPPTKMNATQRLNPPKVKPEPLRERPVAQPMRLDALPTYQRSPQQSTPQQQMPPTQGFYPALPTVMTNFNPFVQASSFSMQPQFGSAFNFPHGSGSASFGEDPFAVKKEEEPEEHMPLVESPEPAPVSEPRAGFDKTAFFDAMYEQCKGEVSNDLMDEHNGSQCSLAWYGNSVRLDDKMPETTKLNVLQKRARDMMHGHLSFRASANKQLVELVARIIDYYTEFTGQERRRGTSNALINAKWDKLYSDMRMGFSWETCLQLIELCKIATEYKRFFYVSTSFFDLAPFVNEIRERLQDEDEALFWSTFGTAGRAEHKYQIEDTDFNDTTDNL